jgi:hypothetical protein
MVEHLERTGVARDRLDEEAISGVRENPLPVHLRALDPRRSSGAAHEPLDPLDPLGPLDDARLISLGTRVLARFDRLSRDDHDAVYEAARSRLEEVPRPLDDARIGHAVLAAASALDLRRWIAEIDAPPTDVARELALAGRRAAALTEREGKVFLALRALDNVAADDEVGKVVLNAAVALQMRWNTAHQNVSRAWRKICEGSPLGEWCGDWRAGHRFVCGLPSLELWTAGRAYMDACNGHGGQGGEAFDAWVQAHEAHNAWFSEWKKQSARAVRRFRDLARVLDASGVRPRAVHAPLVQGCAALGIDRWVIPAKLASQSWRDLLEPAHRPSLPAFGAWSAFLRKYGFGPAAEAAFRALERDTALVDVACVELEHAYRRLLVAAEQQTGESTSARDAFRALLERGAGR